MSEYRPDNPGKLGRQGDNDRIHVSSHEEPAQPDAKPRVAFGERGESGAGPVYEQIPQILVAPLADACETQLAAGRHLSGHEPQPGRQIPSASKGLRFAAAAVSAVALSTPIPGSSSGDARSHRRQ